MGWFSDATGIKTPQAFRSIDDFSRNTYSAIDDARRLDIGGGGSLGMPNSSGGTSGNTSWKRTVNAGVNAAKGLTFDANGNLATPDYANLSQSGMQALQQGQQPSSYLGQAQGFYDQLMGGQQNPYLDATFGKAADAVRQRLDSQFAAAGRYGSDAQQNVMADQYNELANQIYGGQYNADQSNRMQALGMAGNLAQQSYMVPYQAAALQQQQEQAANAYPYEQGMQMVNDYLSTLTSSQQAKYAPQMMKAQTSAGSNQGMANLGAGLSAIGTIGGLFAPAGGAGALNFLVK